MSGTQGGLIAKGDINSNQITNPSNVHQAVVHRDKAANGLGKYYGKLDDGTEEPIGGPGFGPTGGVPFANDTDPAANAVLVSIPSALPPTAIDGYLFEVNILTTNTGATTLTITQNGLGPKSVVDSDGNALVGGELVNESIYLFAYDLQNDRYQLLGLAKPGADECFEMGSGVEACQQINTVFPNNASGDHSLAVNSSTTASGLHSFAEGVGTTASGDQSHSEGGGTIASGDNSHAEGDATESSGNGSHAEGSNTESAGANSHAEGDNTTANGANSHTEGSGTSTTIAGVDAHAEGLNTVASGPNSHSEGDGTLASNASAHSEGVSTIASSIGAHSEGLGTIASNLHAHAEGNGSIASGPDSHAEGFVTQATMDSAHSEGANTIASGEMAHSQGFRTEASGRSSHVGGDGTDAVAGAEVRASGRASFNHSENTAAQTIGDGARGANSAILGGIDADVNPTALRSVALGGDQNKIAAGETDTAQAQELRVTDNIKITQGANKPVGTEALIAGTKTVLNTLVLATSKIFLTRNTISGVIVGDELSVPDATITPGVSFVVNSTSDGVLITDDVSTFNYLIINP